MSNALVKRAASLHLHKYRREHQAFLAEGADLMLAGLRAGHAPQVVFVLEGSPSATAIAQGLWPGNWHAIPVPERVAARIGTLESPAEVIAVFAQPQPAPTASLAGAHKPVVYADHLSDPGNLGTLIRSAAAFGAAAVIASPGSADVWSPKVVRASMGAVFALPLYPDMELEPALVELGRPVVYGLAAHGGADLHTARLRTPAVLCVGAERAGLSTAVRQSIDEPLTITLGAGGPEAGVKACGPEAGVKAGGRATPAVAPAVESLNAAVAASIALYEFSRER